MKIVAFKVVERSMTKLSDVLAFADGQDIGQRLRDIYGIRMRLEDAQKDNKGAWRVDFAKIRQIGPGRAPALKPIEDFDLADDEGFGEETAGYYDPSTNYLILQYNHYGPRSNTIQSYLFQYARLLGGNNENVHPDDVLDGFTLAPVIRSDASAKLQKMGIASKLEFTLYVPSALSNPQTKRQSLTSILDNNIVSSAETIRVEISAGRKRQIL